MHYIQLPDATARQHTREITLHMSRFAECHIEIIT